MDKLLQDIKYGFRSMMKSPGFTLVAVLTLALGIGANTAIFSVVNAVMIRPLPYKDADRLMAIAHAYSKLNMPRGVTVSPRLFDYYRQNATSFESMSAFTGFRAPKNLTGAGEPQRLRTITTSWNLFQLLGAEPMLGRTFAADEDQPGKNRSVVLAYGTWQRLFGGDQGIVGRLITLDGTNYTVVGVMPKGFEYPAETELWVPIGFSANELNNLSEYLNVVAKRKAGVSAEQANAEMAKISQDVIRIAGDAGLKEAGWLVYAAPLREEAVGDMRTAVLVLLAAVGCVLLIACANVANLLLARASARHKEIAIRGALGASSWRMFRQLVTEGVMLSLIGGACGLAFGYWGLELLLSTVPMKVPAYIHVQVDATVMIFTFMLAIVTGVLFSSVPAMQLARSGVGEALKEGGRSSVASGRHGIRSGIIVAELAVSLVLLIGAGLLIKSFMRIQESNPGFNPSKVLTVAIDLPKDKYKAQQQTTFYKELVDRVSTLPGITSTAVSMTMPLQTGMSGSFNIEGKQFPVAPHAHIATISPKYFETMQIPFMKGRVFAEADNATSMPVAIVDTSLVKAYFPGGEDPIGKRLKFESDGNEQPAWREIVGVVGAVKHRSPLENETKGQVYLPYTQYPMSGMVLAVRTQNEPTTMVAAIRQQVQALDPVQPIARVKTMDDMLDDFVAQPRFNMLLLGTFAVLALVLAAIGVYGVMAFSVTQRTHEIGVRMALGAQREDVLAMILKQAGKLALIGLGVGIFGSLLATRVLATLLFGVNTTDPMTFIGITGLLAVIAVAASSIPALRATRVDPNVALRYE